MRYRRFRRKLRRYRRRLRRFVRKRTRRTWMRRTGYRKRSRSTKYYAIEKSGIARNMWVKAVTRLSVPVVVLTPVPNSSITVAASSMVGITRTGFSIYNPFPDIIGNDYSINNYSLLNTMYDKYSVKGLKINVEFRLFGTAGVAFGSCYIVAQELEGTTPTRIEDVMRYKHVTRKPYSVDVGKQTTTVRLKLYLTPRQFFNRKFDPTIDEVSMDANYQTSPIITDLNWTPKNSFQFSILVDNNGAAAVGVRCNIVQSWWLHLKTPPHADYIA